MKPQRFPSTDMKKTITILRCFLCNQLFYAQNTFDTHMKQHQSKINRNIPEEIQRRTMDQFRNKYRKGKNNKNSLLPVEGTSIQLPSNSDDLKSHRVIAKNSSVDFRKGKSNQTMQQPLSPVKKQQPYGNVDDLLSQSTVLMEKMSFLTQQPELEDINEKGKQENRGQKPAIQKMIQETEFQQSIANELKRQKKVNLENAEYLLLRTNFINTEWKSYQQQYEYMIEVEQQVESNSKYRKIKDNILTKIIDEIRKGKQEEKKEFGGGGMAHCSDCYFPIEPHELSHKKNCGHFYHNQCSGEREKCCD